MRHFGSTIVRTRDEDISSLEARLRKLELLLGRGFGYAGTAPSDDMDERLRELEKIRGFGPGYNNTPASTSIEQRVAELEKDVGDGKAAREINANKGNTMDNGDRERFITREKAHKAGLEQLNRDFKTLDAKRSEPPDVAILNARVTMATTNKQKLEALNALNRAAWRQPAE